MVRSLFKSSRQGRGPVTGRVLALGAVLASSFALVACSGSPQMQRSLQYEALDLEVGDLEKYGVAFVTPSSNTGQEQDRQGVANARLGQDDIKQHCALSQAGRDLLVTAVEKLGLSARAFHRILRVARTVADLDASDRVVDRHLTEAIGYRRLDRLD